MAGASDKTRFLREGLFAKYVVSLVGLVVFVLAVNGAMESWISYRATKAQLTDGLEDKAQAAAPRSEQSISGLAGQMSRGAGGRAADLAVDLRVGAPDQLGDAGEPGHAREAPRRLRPAAAPGVGRHSAVPAQRRRPRGAARLAPVDHDRQQRRPLPRHALHRHRRPRRQLRAGLVLRPDAVHVDLGGAFRL